MSDQGKIWFVYQTDHHEGPFTAAEVAEKVKQGLVTGQTLAWKDGMAEWIAAETIAELKSAFSGSTEAPALAPKEGEEEVSLAQLLASQQAPQGNTASMVFQDGASALSSMVAASIPAASIDSSAPADASEPGPNDEVWSMKIGSTVSGLYSLERLKQLATEGEIPVDARLWRVGWTDFQLLSSMPAVASARRSKPAGSTRTALRAGGIVARPGGIAPITSNADIGNDEPTDPQISAPKKSRFGFLDKLKTMFKRKAKAPVTLKTGAVMIGKKSLGGPGIGAAVGAAFKKVALLLLLLAVVGGGTAGYFFFFGSPIPSNLDVLPDDKENLALLVKEPVSKGKKFAVAQARGTEDNPADDTSPKFYVATNMPEGTKINLTLSGKPGTLVNKINFEKTYTAPVAKTQIATFELQDDGKPLAMGEYAMKVTAEGADAYEVNKFLGGKKGAVYERRLKQYREKLEKEYADEVEELREFVSTLKNIQVPLEKHLDAFKTTLRSPADHGHELADWKTFVASFDGMTTQLESKLKSHLDAPDQSYYPRAYQDIAATLGQLRALAKGNAERMSGAASSVNFDEVLGLVQAG
ncbi:MAG: GYF domain-containing protein, partial [Bdellovibrionota bacterium]